MSDDDMPEPMFSSDFDPLAALEWCVDHVNQHHTNINQLIANNNQLNKMLRELTIQNGQLAALNHANTALLNLNNNRIVALESKLAHASK